MTVFKKSSAVSIEKMNYLTKVFVTEDNVSFNISYFDTKVPIEDIPKLLGDFMQLYSMVKTQLDKKTIGAQDKNLELEKPKEDPIDLSDIPF